MRKQIPLSQGQVAIVDERDYARLARYRWQAQWSHRACTYYAVRVYRDKDGKQHTVYMHREILNTPKGMDTDHRDNNGLHNWRRNLRIATRGQNTAASRGPRSTTGYRGVMKKSDPRYKFKKYYAKIVHQGKAIFLGNFETAEAASAVYEAMAKKLFGDFYKPPGERTPRERRDHKITRPQNIRKRSTDDRSSDSGH